MVERFHDTTIAPEGLLREYCLRLGDDCLVLGHRLSEWCGHGPKLEEDIALANVALDNLGVAKNFLSYAASLPAVPAPAVVEIDADYLAFFRDEREFRNCLLVEQPNGDFAHTMVRQFFFSVFANLRYERLQSCGDTTIAGISAKAFKESAYHVRHSREWVLRLGDGTPESHRRTEAAVSALWRFTGELFEQDPAEVLLHVPSVQRGEWERYVVPTLLEATISVPDDPYMASGGRQGHHSEHLGHLLAVMQSVARAHPGAQW